MSVYSGPEISQGGLVFAYDLGNDKSWKGKPTDNKIYTTPLNLTVYAYASGPVSTPNILDGTNKLRTVNRYTVTSTVGIRRAAIQISGLTAGVTYSFSYVYRNNGTGTDIYVDASKGIPEGGANNNTYSLNQVTTQNLSNQWVYVKFVFSFSSCPTGACILAYGNSSGAVGETFDVYNEQFEINSFSTQFVGGTRANTQSILDLTSSCIVTNNEITYNTDGTMKFDGVNDYASISTFPVKPTTQITFECWIKPTKASVGTGTIRGGALSCTNSTYLGIIDSSDGGNTFSFHWANQTTSSRAYCWLDSVPNNAWSHMVGTYDGVNAKAYLNGKLIWTGAQTGTIPDGTYVIGTYGGNLQDGVHNFNGSVDVGRIYNRALTDTEIRQNFNALRGRFGI